MNFYTSDLSTVDFNVGTLRCFLHERGLENVPVTGTASYPLDGRRSAN